MDLTNYIAIVGIITFILLIVEVLIGLRIIKVHIKFHKLLAFIILSALTKHLVEVMTECLDPRHQQWLRAYQIINGL